MCQLYYYAHYCLLFREDTSVIALFLFWVNIRMPLCILLIEWHLLVITKNVNAFRLIPKFFHMTCCSIYFGVAGKDLSEA